MATVSPYHTNSEEYPPKHREVYHDKDTCPDGKKIQPETPRARNWQQEALSRVRQGQLNHSVLLNVISQCGPVGSLASSTSHTRRRDMTGSP